MGFKNKKRNIKIVLMVFILGLAAAYQYDKSILTSNFDTRPLQVGVVGQLKGIQPTTIEEHQEKLIASALYEGLVYYDEQETTLKPLLAEKWSYAKDGKTLSIKISKNAEFHNGKKVTSMDVKSAWERNFLSTKDWSNLNMLDGLVGANEFKLGKKQVIAGIETPDKESLIIKFSSPNYAFVYNLTNPLFWVSEASKPEEIPVGTGPYLVLERDETKINLIRNERYYRGKAPLTAIHVHCYTDANAGLADYKAGKLDYLDQVPVSEIDSLSGDEKFKDRIIQKPVLEFYYLGFNLNRQPYMNNYLLRRALNYAVDRQAMIKNVFGGGFIEARGAIPMGIPGHRKEIICGYNYNDERARSLLEEAGYPLGKNLPGLTLTTNKGTGHLAMATELKNQFDVLGIPLLIQENDWEYYKKQLPRMAMSFFRISWRADYPDADNFLYSLFHSSNIGLSNFSGYSNSQVDRLLDDSRAEPDYKKRIELIQKAEEIVIDDAPHLWLFQKQAAKLIGGDVQGLEINCMEMVDWFKIGLIKREIDEQTK